MDLTTLLAYLSGSVDEDHLRRNQQPQPCQLDLLQPASVSIDVWG